jgi:hypothetical protein
MTAAPNPSLRTASGISHARIRPSRTDVTMRLTPIKFENIIDLATRGEPPLVAGFKS